LTTHIHKAHHTLLAEPGKSLTEAFLKINGLRATVMLDDDMSLPSKAVSLVVAEPYYDGFNNHWAEAALMQFCAKLAEVQPYLASGFKVVSSLSMLLIM
jgi:hypothetical protein